ncbi:MAG: efflux RND transporter periplasmic adaptor subunit [Planctomycetaceae bacterium]
MNLSSSGAYYSPPADRVTSKRARGGAVALCLLLGCVGCGPKPTPETANKKPIADLVAETLVIQSAPWPNIVRSQGELRADEVVAIGARVAGRVSEVKVELGDHVKAGQPCVVLDPKEFELLVSQAEAQLAQARSAVGLPPEASVDSLDPDNAPPVRQERAIWNEAKSSLERASQLRKQNAIAVGEYDLVAVAERVAEAKYASALNSVREKIALIGVREAELSLARQRLADAVIKAPFDGFIQQRAVAPGAYVNVGTAILSLVRTDPLWYRGTLPERHAGQLRTGLEIVVDSDSLLEPIKASITRVSPALDPQSRSLVFEAKIANPDNRLRTGLFAEADVVLDPEAESIVIPSSAVARFAGAEKVWKVVDQHSVQHEIVLGLRRGDNVEVIDGLVAGDVILVDGAKGRIARIIPPASAAGSETPVAAEAGDLVDASPIPEG